MTKINDESDYPRRYLLDPPNVHFGLTFAGYIVEGAGQHPRLAWKQNGGPVFCSGWSMVRSTEDALLAAGYRRVPYNPD